MGIISRIFKRRARTFDVQSQLDLAQKVDFKKQQPIFIYQMGRVGSIGVFNALVNSGLSDPILYFHILSDKWINFIKDVARENQVPPPSDLEYYDILRRKIEENRDSTPWRIITAVREPVSKEISHIFQENRIIKKTICNEKGEVDRDKSYHYARKRLLDFRESENFCCNWFQDEIEQFFGVDVFQHPFPYDKKYQIIEQDNVRILIFRLENLSQTFSKGIKEFLGIKEDLPLVKANMGGEKFWAKEYQYTIENMKLPKDICRRIYDSKYMRHFYTEEERQGFLRKWAESEK